jgi:hypothetical protein
LQLINPSTSPNELNKTLMPHSIHPRRCLLRLLQQNLGHPRSATRAKTVLQCSDIQDKLIEQTACVRSAVIRNDIFALGDAGQIVRFRPDAPAGGGVQKSRGRLDPAAGQPRCSNATRWPALRALQAGRRNAGQGHALVAFRPALRTAEMWAQTWVGTAIGQKCQ